MACDIFNTDNAVVYVRLSDFMRPSDQQALQAVAEELIEKGHKPRVLAILANFRGWERSEEWGDVGFLMERGDHIVKLAIVGDERWRDEVFLFVGRGLRATEIEFFSPACLKEAEVWVRA